MRRAILLCAGVTLACGGFEDVMPGDIPFSPERPAVADDRNVAPYTGSNAHVLDAQDRLYTGYDLHRKVIQRSCSGPEAVCHNQAEYPDMRTPARFAETIGARCNADPTSFASVYDRCEQPGDRLRLGDAPAVEIGHVLLVEGEHVNHAEAGTVPDATSAGLHFLLAAAADIEDDSLRGKGRVSRVHDSGGAVTEFLVTEFDGKWWVLEGGKRLFAEVPANRVDKARAIVAAGIREGDANRNGTFGAQVHEGVSLIEPGEPERSYLVARLRGTMLGEPVPGTRMPLANLPPTIPDMLALMCFIEGLPGGGATVDLGWPIDYAACSYSADPEALALTGGGGPTWSGRVQPLLEANCTGCHGGDPPQGGLDLTEPGLHPRLLGASGQKTGLALVEPGNPGASYLWLKLTGDPSIDGSPMPSDGMGGSRMLTPDELADIETWITSGALRD